MLDIILVHAKLHTNW